MIIGIWIGIILLNTYSLHVQSIHFNGNSGEYGGWLVVGSGLRIYGDRIVYEGEGASTNYNIYMYDLST